MAEAVLNPSVTPAHALFVELATRTTTQKLHYRSGDEEAAVKSISSLFGTVRTLMTEHVAATEFHRFALVMLNEVIRPCTARWHGWMTQEGDKIDREGKPLLKFRDEWVRRKFREELRELQPRLLGFQRGFQQLSEGKKFDEKWGRAELDPTVLQELLEDFQRSGRPASLGGGDLPMKIRPQVILRAVNENGRVENSEIAGRIAAEESKRIQSRRAALGHAGNGERLENVAGLALSGGGIRSATFCLGIVQALQQRGLFEQFDYLSTVSGGGYLGTFLSSLLGVDGNHLAAVEKAVETRRDGKLTGKIESATLSTDRQEESPAGKKEVESGAGAVAAGTPLPAEPRARLQAVFDGGPNAAESEAFQHLRNNSRYLLNGGTWGVLKIIGVLVTGIGSSLLILLSLPVFAAWVLRLLQFFDAPSGFRYLFLGLAALLGFLWLLIPLTRRLAQGTKWDSWASKVASLVGTSLLVGGVVAAIFGVLGYAPGWVEKYDATRQLIVDAWPALTKWIVSDKVLAVLFGAIPAAAGALMKGGASGPRPWAKGLFAITGPLFFLLAFLVTASALGVGGHPAWDLGRALGITAFALLWIWTLLNINAFSLHSYYRDRLCECYLAVMGRRQRSWLTRKVDRILHGVPDTDSAEEVKGIGTVQRLPLSALGQNAAAPYHLINATLNAAASKNPTLRGRNGDFFLFSQCYCGSPLTGYLPTQDLEKVDPHVDLGTAMAISGAAASTNMGWQTMTQYRFLLTLFNIRLGYWLRRPGSQALSRPFEGPGPLYFFRELFGGVQEKTRYINLSDGGHLENLAVYELLRRQCKFILCVDAGMEPKMECADLMRLQRYATIDLGIRMHFDPADLTLLPTNFSRAYAVLVKIDYHPPPPGADPLETSEELGWMLYLKLALTGTEPRYVLDYRRQNPQFPHQTTGDQFYDEAQFEAYRALGEAAVESLYREEVLGPALHQDGPLKLSKWFQELVNSFLPDNDRAFVKETAPPAGIAEPVK